MEITQHIELADFKVVDFHVHLPVASDDWLAPWRERYIAENGEERFHQLQSRTGTSANWLPELLPGFGPIPQCESPQKRE